MFHGNVSANEALLYYTSGFPYPKAMFRGTWLLIVLRILKSFGNIGDLFCSKCMFFFCGMSIYLSTKAVYFEKEMVALLYFMVQSGDETI